MESFEEAFESLVSMGPETLDRFGASMPRSWIDEALAATGSASIRRRKLPADQAVWLVVGMALYEDRPIRDVVDHLSLVLPGVESLAPSAITQARHRLGPEPMEWLFRRVAHTWSNVGGGNEYSGLSLYAVDGTCLRVQDTDENFAHFGKPGSRNGSGDAGYPQARLACLMNLETRLLVDASFGPYATSEHELARSLWDSVPDNSLTILDRGFVDYVSVLGIFPPGGSQKHWPHGSIAHDANQCFRRRLLGPVGEPEASCCEAEPSFGLSLAR